MRVARDVAQQIGRSILTPQQRRQATLPYVLSLFGATGLSESERLETAYMLQKFIVEGFLRGINVPELMNRRAQREGMLHIGFSDGPVPNRNTIQFDRESWRSRPDSFRATEFMNKLGTRLSATQTYSPPPRMNNASRQFQERPRSGALRSGMTEQAMQKVANRVISAVSPSAISGVFENLSKFQQNIGVTAPQPMTAPRHIGDILKSQAQVAMVDRQESNLFETRQEMVERGMDPMRLQGMPARSGIGSPRNTGPGLSEGLAASGRPNRIVIYSGAGTWGEEVNAAAADARALGIQVDIKSSLSGVDYNQYGAVIVPGGNSLEEFNGIGSSEIARLKQAINGGLNFMGHCAGAFLAGRMGIISGMPDYPSTNYYGGGAQVTVDNTIKWGGGGTRDVLFYGGPDLTGFGKELAEHPSGASTVVSNNYGQGHLILTAGHFALQGPDDRDGPDNDLYKQLLQAIVAGTDPGGASPPPPGGPPSPPGSPPGTPPQTPPGSDITVGNTNNVYDVNPVQVQPGSSTSGMPLGGRKKSGAPFRKTPVAGMLNPEATGSTFAAGLSDIMRRSAPMLNQMAGALQGLK